MSYECNRCGEDSEEKRIFVTIYNSQFNPDTDLLTDADVDFEVDFGGEEFKLIDICGDCESAIDWSKVE
jgi:hypothetical protein